jgi:hypothetical protein
MGNSPSKQPTEAEGRFFRPAAHPPLRILEDKGVQTVLSFQR